MEHDIINYSVFSAVEDILCSRLLFLHFTYITSLFLKPYKVDDDADDGDDEFHF